MFASVFTSGLLMSIAGAAITSIAKPSYEDFVSNGESSLVLFTADGCAACDTTVKELEQTQLDLGVIIGEVNCAEEPDICDENRIFTVPTLMLSVGDGTMVKYRDRLSSLSITPFMKRQSGQAVTEVAGLEGEDFQNPTSITVVALLEADDAVSRATFDTVATKLRAHYAFMVCTDRSTANFKGVNLPSIIVYKPFDERKVIHADIFSPKAIEDFLRKATTPLIQEMDPEVYDSLIEVGKPVAFIFTNSLDDKYDLAEQLYPLANQTKDDLTFLSVNVNDYPKIGQSLGLGDKITRGFAIEDVRTTRAYPLLVDTLSLDAMKAFVQQFLSNSLSPVIKSDPVLKLSSQSSSLATLVGSNFEDYVMDKSKDILVEFCVPWYDYCSDLQKVMDSLGQKYAQINLSNKVALATIDVSTNDVPVRITGYPTLILFRAGDNKAVHFDGTFFELLSEEQLASFISANSMNEVVIPLGEPEQSSILDDSPVGKDEL
ncbi:related to protein disulfide-isomerase precursor [Rhynchosporium secalis]|uniref:Protein disulfide-isomerase n=1 Tax=Rhynchosporium secalis TaxID=38038 RepID=A0A1E1MKZ5_RHYSE|nr:related to protein disulfide-isomerase precursor [Rhynchosporium secalis]